MHDAYTCIYRISVFIIKINQLICTYILNLM